MLGDTLLDEWVEFGAQLVDTLPISLPELEGAGAAVSSAPSLPPRRGALSRRIIAEEEVEEEAAEEEAVGGWRAADVVAEAL